MHAARFQTFDDLSDVKSVAPRVSRLRDALAAAQLDGWIVPRADRQQNEYVPPSEERLAWLTGFTGSAGAAIVLPDKAALFVDGRYQVQAPQQTDTAIFAIEQLVDTPPHQWLKANAPRGGRIGYDPWLHTPDQAERLAKACTSAGASLVPVDHNPIDTIWTDRPAPPQGKVTVHPVRYAGVPAADKLSQLRDRLAHDQIDALVLSDPHAVAWAFNIRGSDVPHTPLALAFAIVSQTGQPVLYLDNAQLGPEGRDALASVADIRPPQSLLADLAAFARKTVQIDRASAADALARALSDHDATLTRAEDPVVALKAVKNETEIAGARAAHQRDGVAMCRFLAWFDREAPRGALTEIDAVEALEQFRRDTGLLKDVSFPTIAGAGPNGAIVHYRVTRATNRTITPGDLFLIDSGAQYEDGTTDITRTIAVGAPTPEMRDRFTRVLKGHIAIASARFPDGTSGAQLDTLARAPLWDAGLDFDHGTGHGVGSYLSVHEGPQRISKLGTVPLKRGMILSNEPGYYKAGAYGIRIENLVLVTAADQPAGAEKKLNSFETLTLVPIDQRLIDVTMLSERELHWLDAYHTRVDAGLRPLLDDETRDWFDNAVQPLGHV